MGGCGTPENPERSCICLAGLLGFSLLCLGPDFLVPPDAPRSMGAAAQPHRTPLTPGVWAFLDSPGSYTPVALSSTKLERLRGRFEQFEHNNVRGL